MQNILDLKNNLKIAWSLDGQKIAYSIRVKRTANSVIKILNLKDGQIKKGISHQTGINYPVAWINEPNRLLYYHTSAIEPPTYWNYELGSGVKKIVFKLSSSVIANFLRNEQIILKTNEGDLISHLYYPSNFDSKKKYPLIIWLGGGPFVSYLNEFDPFYYWLANNDFITASINYRGCGGVGIKFADAVIGAKLGVVELADLRNFLKYVQNLSFIDTERMGIGGASYGGYLVLRAIEDYSYKFQCAVASSAIIDWKLQLKYSEAQNFDNLLLGRELGGNTRILAEKSPISYIENIKTPLLLTHGMQDNNVPFVQVRKFVSKCEEYGIHPDYLFFKNGAHGLNSLTISEREKWAKDVLQFFKKYLYPQKSNKL